MAISSMSQCLMQGIHRCVLPATQQAGRTLRLLSNSTRVTDSQDDIRSAYSYCIQQVQQFEYDNYVWISQLQKEVRPAMFMLRAFNIETALIAGQVKSKEPALMQVRYQWWRDGISSAYKGQALKHPVLVALHDVLQRQGKAGTQPESASQQKGPSKGLQQYHFKRIIDAREADMLDTQPPLTMEGLEQYAEGTASQLLYLQLEAAGATSRESDHAASHLGKAIGITTLLRGAAFHAAQRRSYLPIDLCAKHGVSQESVYARESSEGLKDVVLAVASVARGHLDEARALRPKLPKHAASVFLPSLACDQYLKDLEACDFDVFDAKLQQQPDKQGSPLMHVLRVKWHLLMGTF